MNDRYLYRAKRTDNGKWVEGHLVFDDIDNQYRIAVQREYSTGTFYGAQAPRVKRDTICQCTGLKDKNGKLIWENDIIEAHLDDLFPKDISRFQVLWKDYSFKIRLEKELYDDFSDYVSELFEVAGNIFDNQELLEVGE